AFAHVGRILVIRLQLGRDPADLPPQRPDVARIAERGPADAAARRGAQLPVQQAQERALAGAVAAPYEPLLAGLQPKMQPLERAAAVEIDRGVLDDDERLAGSG